MRMMVDFSGANRYVEVVYSTVFMLNKILSTRGYCYVRYCKIEEAQKAIKTLDNYQIRPGSYLRVTRSVDNKKICLKTVPPIPSTFTEEKVLGELRRVLDGASSVRFLNKWWLQVEFTTHRNAALARRKVVPGNVTIFQTQHLIKQVDWADPDMKDYLTNLERKKTISVRNLPHNITKHRISRAFNFLSGKKVENVVINFSSNSALVTFNSPKDAKSVLDEGSNLELEGQKAELSWCGAQEEEKEKSELMRQEQPREERSQVVQSMVEQQPGPAVVVEPWRALENLLSLSLSLGWGAPQYFYRTALTVPPDPQQQQQLVYQCSLTFPALPGLLVQGLPSLQPGIAAFSAACSALEGISRSSHYPPAPYTFPQCPQYPQYYYPPPVPSLPGSQTNQSEELGRK